ncbi:hypothetical protein U9M48_029393 [Paspalum notatum var. saurae]|uniref:Reverse transcriptase zinc-binding domain-containing protein n=1 Tax=Paspalum notatum var. saurae TaxID=547442 RepID=A0AAQ3X296_PASNO
MSELTTLIQMLEQVQLTDSPDERTMRLSTSSFNSRQAYGMLMDSSIADGNGLRIWKSRMPNKVKVFAWLFFRDRLSTRVNLHRKHVQPVDTCSRCGTSSESWQHAFFHCPYTAELWSRIGVDISNVQEMEDLWSAHHPAAVCSATGQMSS